MEAHSSLMRTITRCQVDSDMGYGYFRICVGGAGSSRALNTNVIKSFYNSAQEHNSLKRRIDPFIQEKRKSVLVQEQVYG